MADVGYFKGQIDATNAAIRQKEDEVRLKEEKRESSDEVAEKAVILESINVLNSRIASDYASRDRYEQRLLALCAPLAPAPGTNTPLAFDVSAPLYFSEHATPPPFFVSAPLV